MGWASDRIEAYAGLTKAERRLVRRAALGRVVLGEPRLARAAMLRARANRSFGLPRLILSILFLALGVTGAATVHGADRWLYAGWIALGVVGLGLNVIVLTGSRRAEEAHRDLLGDGHPSGA